MIILCGFYWFELTSKLYYDFQMNETVITFVYYDSNEC